MKAVMISIRPPWCQKIASGKKTMELRKSKPKLELPFKCYIYCTIGCPTPAQYEWCDYEPYGMVIGEFVCDAILSHCEMANADIAEQMSCVRREKILEYSGGKEVFGWHISGLVIYDTPKELGEFCVEGDCNCMNCHKCGWFERGNGYNVEDDCGLVYEYMGSGKTLKPLFRPPQSWLYVEEI